MNRFSLSVLFAVVASMLGGIAGCRDDATKTWPVRGLVRLPDGTILRDGSVEFECIECDPPVTAVGTIGPDGQFVLGTYDSDDGALAGKHRVAVIADYTIGTGAERPGLIPDSPIHSKYRSFATSGLVVEVKRGDNDVILDVDFPDKPQLDSSEKAESD